MLALIAPATSATLLLIALLVWQQKGLPGRRDLAFCLCLGAVYFLYHVDRERLSFLLPVLFLGPYACNRAIRSSFELGERAPWLEAVTAVLLMGFGMLGYFGAHFSWAANGFNVLSLVLFAEIPSIVVRGIEDDLINARRTARVWVLSLSGSLGVLIAIASISGLTEFAVTFGGLATLLLGFVTVALGPRLVAPLRTVASSNAPSNELAELNSREILILRRLERLMRDETLHRDSNLSLSRLSQRLEVPEHRLRRVIHLGAQYKNFSHFVHAYRLSDFKARIDDPKQDNETILGLALSVGYSSLSAFNRAFKLIEGTTPSDYRNVRLAARTAKTSASMPNPAEVESAI